MSVHQTKDGRWYCQYYKPNTRRSSRKYFGRGSKAKLTAEAWDKDFRLKKKAGRLLPDQKPVPDSATFNEIAIAYLKQKPIAETTRKTISYALQNINEVFGGKAVANLTMKDLTELDSFLISKGRTLATRNRYRSYCRAILQWGAYNGLIEENPFVKFKPDRAREAKAPDIITDEELRAIWNSAPPHVRWVVTCMLNLGVRPGRTELFAIKMSDVDFDQAGIWITRTKTHSRRELIPCHQDFLEKIAEIKKKEPGRVFLIEYPRKPGKPVTSIKTAWWNTLRRAGIYKENVPEAVAGQTKQIVRGQERRIRLYDLRHKFATMLLSSGADIKATSEILGHSNTSTTMTVYYHLMERQKRSAIDLIQIPDFEGPDSEE